MVFTETKVTDAANTNTVLVDHDVKNNSTTDYDVSTGSRLIELDIKVTTTDGTVYDDTSPLTATRIAAGSTASAGFMADYGAGKTYKSYTISARCR